MKKGLKPLMGPLHHVLSGLATTTQRSLRLDTQVQGTLTEQQLFLRMWVEGRSPVVARLLLITHSGHHNLSY